MTESSAPQPIHTRPAPTDKEAAAIIAAVVAIRNLQAHASDDSPDTPEPSRWSRAGRLEMTRAFERTHDE